MSAGEALSFGLANRVVPRGQSRPAAEALARELAAFPQICLRGDRRSAYEQRELGLELALRQEHRIGLASIDASVLEGATRFAGGQGKHGAF